MADISQVLIDQVKTAAVAKSSIVIEGGGTKKALGREINPDDELLSTQQHSGIVDYKPKELIMTARAGTTLAEIDNALKKNNQILACDPRRFGGTATIGGSLAANQSGHARPWCGSLRDHVLGTKLINGKGEHLRFGGQVLKNVAGYDVSRLQAGAMGAFGVITEVSFKVLPEPESTATMRLAVEAEDALLLMNKIAGTAIPLTGFSWVNDEIRLRIEGVKKAVDATIKQLQNTHEFKKVTEIKAQNFWQQLREHEHEFFATARSKKLWRFSVNAAAKHVLQDQSWAFNWSGSQRWLFGDFDLSDLAEKAQSMQGDVQLFTGGDRSLDLALIKNPAMKLIIKNMKNSFDPDNIFNRGRLYSWL